VAILYKCFYSSLIILLITLVGAAACGESASEQAGSPTPTETPAPGRGGAHGPGVTETDIVLGMTNDISGTGDTPYSLITKAMQAYFRKVSVENGGVCARRVVLLAEDDGYTPQGALEKTKKLIEQDHVLAMVGALGTPVHAPVAGYLNDPNGDGNTSDGIPDLFISTGWSGWGDVTKYPWTIGFIPDYLTDARVLTRYVNDHFGDKKVAILHENDEFGNDYLRGVQESIAKTDNLVSVQAADPAPDALKRQLSIIRDAGAEAIILALTPEHSAEVLRTAEADGYAPKWLMSYVNSPSAVAREIGGGTLAEQLLKGFDDLKGTVGTQYLMSAIDDADAPPMMEHRRIMETFNGPVVSTLSVYGQSVAEAVIETLKRSCDSITRESVLRAAESLQHFHSSLMLDGVELNLGAKDHFAIQTLQPVEIQKDGTLKDVGDPIAME
jgi:branched-chain amino acid transport system substrate-binding protein